MDELLIRLQAVAGQPRLRCLLALRHGELCVCELEKLLDLAPATVSRHLRDLTRAGLVRVRQSGRWRYFRRLASDEDEAVLRLYRYLDTELAGGSALATDDGKIRAIIAGRTGDCPGRRPRVLFLCTGNSCRSQMGEAWCRQLHGKTVETFSAGVEVHGLNLRMLQVMKEAGVDTTALRSKHVDELAGLNFDLVITVCDHAAESCPILPGAINVMHRPFADPPGLTKGMTDEKGILEIYRRVRDEIREFVEKELLKVI